MPIAQRHLGLMLAPNAFAGLHGAAQLDGGIAELLPDGIHRGIQFFVFLPLLIGEETLLKVTVMPQIGQRDPQQTKGRPPYIIVSSTSEVIPLKSLMARPKLMRPMASTRI